MSYHFMPPAWRCPLTLVLLILILSAVANRRVLAQDASQATGVNPDVAVPRFLDPAHSLSVRFPTTSTNRLGWTMRVRVSSLRTADTMRVELDFASTGGPTAADQNIELRLNPMASGQAPPQSSIRVSLPLRIPEGTQQLRFARHVPKSSYGNQYSVQLFEEGRAIANCRAPLGQPITFPESAMHDNLVEQETWRMLWVQSSVDEATRTESMQMLALTFIQSSSQQDITPEQWDAQLDQDAKIKGVLDVPAVPLTDLPFAWQALRSFDAITMHRKDWQKIATGQSAQASAIRDWIHSGGVMIVRDAQASRDDVRMSAVYGSPSPESINAAIESANAHVSHLGTAVSMSPEAFFSATDYTEMTPERAQYWKDWFSDKAERIRQSIQEYGFADAIAASGVRSRQQLAGTVVFLGRQNDEPIERLQWTSALDLIGWRRSRLVRSGVDPILGSQRFFQWVIPGVSQPPVYTFMGLLGIFVILVGPVAYRKTAKTGRAYLMFAIAPVLAITTTIAMLGYSVIADGFGIQVRSRQITWVDGTSGEAFTRIRSTYFAGIQPATGLAFPPDASVTLFPDNQDRSWESRVDDRFETRGTAIATDSKLRLNREFLPSRQQRQFVIERPAPHWGRIVVLPNPETEADAQSKRQVSQQQPSEKPRPQIAGQPGQEEPLTGPESIRVRSEATVPLYELILCDAGQRYYVLDELHAGATASAQQISPNQASKRMGEMYKRQWLVSDAGQSQRKRSNFNPNSRSEVTDLIATELAGIEGPEKPAEGVFEYELQKRMQLQSNLPAGSFLALTDLSQEAIATEGAEVAASIHFVIGSLP